MANSLLRSINGTNAPLSTVCSTRCSRSCSCSVWAAVTAGKALCRFNKSAPQYAQRTNANRHRRRGSWDLNRIFVWDVFNWSPGSLSQPALLPLLCCEAILYDTEDQRLIWQCLPPSVPPLFKCLTAWDVLPSSPTHGPSLPWPSSRSTNLSPVFTQQTAFNGFTPLVLLKLLAGSRSTTSTHKCSAQTQRTVSNNTTEQTSIVMRNCCI